MKPQPARVARLAYRATLLGLAEFKAEYTPASWLFGWLLRLVFQVMFFGISGRLVGDTELVRYLVIGNAVAIGALEATVVVVSIVGEKWSGTYGFLLSTPGNHVAALLFRSFNWPFNGLLSTNAAMLIAAVLLGVPVAPADLVAAAPVVFVCLLSAYFYGACMGAVVLRRPSLAFTALNVSYLVLMVFAGVNVPIAAWPRPVRWGAEVLPVTHGLTAVRALLDGAAITSVLDQVGLELLVGLGWFLAAVALIRFILARARRDGTADLF